VLVQIQLRRTAPSCRCTCNSHLAKATTVPRPLRRTPPASASLARALSVASSSSRSPPLRPAGSTTAMFILGLTGSIGMGKSSVAGVLLEIGVPVLDADAVVHRLYAPGGAAVEPVRMAFAGVLTPEGGISRPALSKHVLGDDAAMKKLEDIVHPLVDAARWEFLAQAEAQRQPLVVFDIPLLYEKGYEATVDAVLVVSTGDAAVQRSRVLGRPGMTPEKLDAIMARQLPDADKRARADYIINSNCPMQDTAQAVRALVVKINAAGGADATAYDKLKGEPRADNSGKA